MRAGGRSLRIVVATLMLALVGGLLQTVSAIRYTSTSYVIDASVANDVGGSNTSTSYKLVGSGGEAAVGNGTGGSYVVGMGFVAQLDKNLSITLQPSGLVAAYPLDETTGSLLMDTSVNNAYGQMQGTLSSAAGKLGTGLSFDGSSQAVSIGNTTQTQLGSGGTVEAWIKSTTTTGSLAAIAKSSNFWLGLGNGKASVYDWTSGVTTSDTTVIADNSWHHIAMTLNSGVANGSTLYVDGSPKQTFIWTPASQTGSLVIGAVYNGSTYGQYFNGVIDQVKVFNRILSADEIQAEYAAQTAGVASGLSLGTITPGISNAVLTDVIARTDAGAYTLAISQDHDLTDGTYTISPVSGNIASPVAWSEGSTKGLGFTLTATNATAIPGSWNSGNSYAAFPASATTFYTRTGLQSGDDYLTLRIRADVASTQVSSNAAYTNTVTVTGTISP